VTGPDDPRHDRGDEARHEAQAATGFFVTFVAAVALAVVYWRGGQPQLEGVFLAAALGGLAYGFVVWGHHLLPPGPVEEPRHDLESTPGERARFEADLNRVRQGPESDPVRQGPESDPVRQGPESNPVRQGPESNQRGGEIERRKVLTRMLGLAAAALGAAAVFPIRSLGPSPGKSLERTPWKAGSRLVTEDGTPLTVDAIPVGGFFTVFPEGHVGSADGQTVLVRVEDARVGVQGLLAFNKVCTHAGCPVGLYQADSHQLLCPCHQSAFDVLHGASPVFGPATRHLPELPITVDPQGFLRARSDYTEPIGPAYWNRK